VASVPSAQDALQVSSYALRRRAVSVFAVLFLLNESRLNRTSNQLLDSNKKTRQFCASPLLDLRAAAYGKRLRRGAMAMAGSLGPEEGGWSIRHQGIKGIKGINFILEQITNQRPILKPSHSSQQGLQQLLHSHTFSLASNGVPSKSSHSTSKSNGL